MHNRCSATKWLFVLRTLCVLTWPLLLAACRSQASDPPDTVSVGTTTNEVNTLILVAKEQEYFSGNGIDLIHKIYPSGVAGLGGVLAHEVDLATGSEFALVGQVLASEELCTIASIDRSSVEHLVARQDRGIHDLADLKGKTIGVPLNSRPEFALDRFLYFQGIDVSELNMVDVPVNQSVEKLVSGAVDAVATWQPYVDQAVERLGGQVVTWSVQEGQPSYTLVMSRMDWVAENQDVVARFLRALAQAEEYVVRNPEAARALLHKSLGLDEAYIASGWPEHTFSIQMDQALVVAMEDQARWIMNKNPAASMQMPDMLRHFCSEGLEHVKPEAVNLIR
jgi:ABC-type nitrate/sulfonate/bicarbonate transport system substrate-binding protein